MPLVLAPQRIAFIDALKGGPNAHRWAWALYALASVAVLAGIGWAARSTALSEQESVVLKSAIEPADASNRGAPSAAPEGCTPADFTAGLRSQLDEATLLEHLNRVATGLRIDVADLRFAMRARTPEQLGRSDVSGTLRGAYAPTRAFLVQATERFPGTTLTSVRMRRGKQVDELETAFVFSVWLQPLGRPVANCGTGAPSAPTRP